ncbi:16S rRNA (uracil(1498)-N(3))-methyltransferase [Ornithinimicrobium sp. Y1847]|uniref:16S rRNA (uracil(1498)-N(3))-methyltransferase n=1 Tax=unclassified Ornithinimicrobium TaxID=2615080 RepID=UPI003B67E2C6
MTAPLFLVPAGTLAEGTTSVLLEGPEGRHAADVQRLTEGEEVLISDGAGRYAVCQVTQARRGELELAVHDLRELPQPSPRLVLIQALAKGERDLMAIEAATELDVDEVVPWQADRSIVRWRGDRGTKAHRKWEQTVLTATKQSRRARVPVVAEPATRHTVLGRIGGAALALVLHEEAQESIGAIDLPAAGDVLLVVGPEGGISPEELAAFTDAGARPVRLGSTVLRTSTAGPAALAVLNARGRWR